MSDRKSVVALSCVFAFGLCASCSDESSRGDAMGSSQSPDEQGTEQAGAAASGGPSNAAGAAGSTKPPSGAGTSAGQGGAGQGGAKGSVAGESGAGAAGASGAKASDGASDGVTEAHSMQAADTEPMVADGDYTTFVAHVNTFGLDLGKRLSESDAFASSNLIYSPISAYLALSMTYAGAQGTTASEMKTVLGDSFADTATFHHAANRLSRDLTSRATSVTDSRGVVKKIELNIADSIWTERTITLGGPFLDVLARDYAGGVRQVDFIHAHEQARKNINDWVADQTKQKILDLLPEPAVTDATRIVLVNALYFYGSWAEPFTREGTAPAAFHTLTDATMQVPTMNAQLTLNYRDAGDYALAELPYQSDLLRMTIVLPAPGKFAAVRSQLSAAWLDDAGKGAAPTRLQVALPKFVMTVGSFSLKSELEAAGMHQAFTDKADFSGISRDTTMRIEDVLQKAFISVDEAGTEAAAATAVTVVATSAVPTQPTPFVVDRPFLFFIRDLKGAVLFGGQVTEPKQQ